MTKETWQAEGESKGWVREEKGGGMRDRTDNYFLKTVYNGSDGQEFKKEFKDYLQMRK